MDYLCINHVHTAFCKNNESIQQHLLMNYVDFLVFHGIKMQILKTGSGYTALDADLLESDYKDFIVKLIQDPDGTPIVKCCC